MPGLTMRNPDGTEGLKRNRRFRVRKKRGLLFVVVIAAISLHVIAAIIAGAIMIVIELNEGDEDFPESPITAAPQRRPEYQVNIEKLKKQSSPPRPRPIVVRNPNNINLPAVDMSASKNTGPTQ